MNGLGVDSLGVSFPVTAKAADRFLSSDEAKRPHGGKWVHRNRYEATIRLGVEQWPDVRTEGGAGERKVKVCLVPREGGWTGTVEGNPSRWHDPQGRTLADLSTFMTRLPAHLEGIVGAARLEPDTSMAQWSLTRLDLARDFEGVMAPSALIEGLRIPRRQYCRQVVVYCDPANGVAQTLQFGNKSRMVRLYDRVAAHPNNGIPAGSVRWEVQMRADWLHKHSIRTVGDLGAPALEGLADKMWEWSRCGSPTTSVGFVLHTLERRVVAGELSVVIAQRLLGQFVAEASGRCWPVDPKTAKKHEALSASLGWPTPQEWSTLGDLQVSRSRLDWASGTQVHEPLSQG